MSEISPVENRCMGLMRGLDEFSRDKFGIEIIDHDYAPDHDNGLPGFHSLVGFQRELSRLHDDVDENIMNPETIRCNIESTSHVIDAIPYAVTEDSVGRLPFPDYAQKVMGIRPEEISESKLAEQREEVKQAAANLGFEYKEEDRERFHAEYSLPSKRLKGAVRKLVGATRDDLIEAAGEQAMEGIEQPKIKTVNAADTWEGYFGTKNKKFFIGINTNPLIRISEPGERVVLNHERGHALSSATSKMLIAEGELSPALGFLLCQSPMYFQEEVIARTVERYVLGKSSEDLAAYLYPAMRYENNVRTNMILRANGGMEPGEVFDYGREKIPYEDPDRTSNFLQMITKNLVFKTVFAVDSKAMELGDRIAALPDADRHAILGRLCAEPVDTDELLDLGLTETTA